MKRRKKKGTGFKPSCLVVLCEEIRLRDAAAAAGISLRVSVINGHFGAKGRPTLHMMFDCCRTGRRLVDFWPGSNTVLIFGERGKAEDSWHALRMAAKVLPGESVRDVLVKTEPAA
jgi:hypothetical protein